MIYTLHGWSFSREVWRGTPFERAVHLELPGHGESPFKSTNLEELSDEISEELKPNSTLVGWSLGATVSILIAYRHPEKVRELILYAPTTSFTGLSQPEVVVKRFLKRLRRDFKGGVNFFREISSRRREKVPPLNPEIGIELLKNFTQFNCDGLVGKLKVPIKILVGDKDEVTKIEGAYRVFEKAPRSQLKVVPEEDHLTILQYAI